jgi:N-acetylglucosamine kinase-like BadF-type ATPase
VITVQNYSADMELVVDLGQSGARVRIGGETLALSIPKTAAESVLQTLARIFAEIPKRPVNTVYLSLTGLHGDVDDVEPYGKLCHSALGATSVCVMDDGIAAYAGALGDRSGVVLTLGGGVVAVGSHSGRFSHADGKGPIFGDLGGGFWVGQTALRKAIATLDGRDSASDLVDLMSAELSEYASLSDPSGVEAARLCISAAKTVAEGAGSGVEGAHRVLESGAQHLAKTIRAAWNKVSPLPEQTADLCIAGGLSRSTTYVRLIEACTRQLMPCTLVTAEGDHLVGAPRAAALHPTGVDPLLKWWHA